MSNQAIKVVATGEQLIIREGQAPNIFVYGGFQHTADSTGSFIDLVKAKGSQEGSVIAYNENGIKVILDDRIKDRKQDTVNYQYKKSLQFREWEGILVKGCVYDQKNLIDFLKRREPGEIDNVELFMAALQNFKFVTNITGDYTFDDRNNYTFSIKIGEAEGTVRIPQIIMANVEIYLESGLTQSMEIEVEVQKPKGEGEKPLFRLSCPKFERYLVMATENEVNKVKKDLEGYLIIAGSI